MAPIQVGTNVETFKMARLEVLLHQVAEEHRKRVFDSNTVSRGIGEYFISDFVDKRPKGQKSMLSLGCGKGTIEIASVKSGADYAVGVDKNREAIAYARSNAELNGISGRCTFVTGDMYEPVNGETFDAIIHDASSMARGVAKLTPWYPDGIDSGGELGTETSIKAIEGADRHLKENGFFYFPRITLADYKAIAALAKKRFGNKLVDINDSNFPRRIPFHDCLFDQEKLEKGIKVPHPVLVALKERGIIHYDQIGSRFFWYLYMQVYRK